MHCSGSLVVLVGTRHARQNALFSLQIVHFKNVRGKLNINFYQYWEVDISIPKLPARLLPVST